MATKNEGRPPKSPAVLAPTDDVEKENRRESCWGRAENRAKGTKSASPPPPRPLLLPQEGSIPVGVAMERLLCSFPLGRTMVHLLCSLLQGTNQCDGRGEKMEERETPNEEEMGEEREKGKGQEGELGDPKREDHLPP